MFTQVITQFSLSPKNCLANIWQLPNYEKTGIPEIDSPYARGHHVGGGVLRGIQHHVCNQSPGI